MGSLEYPTLPETLYFDRGNVGRGRPIMQGDVFKVDGADVMVLTHPCTMRGVDGVGLRKKLSACPVNQRERRIEKGDWTRSFKAMPLPNLRGEGADWQADLFDLGGIEADALDLRNRTASLSDYGIFVLQQRMIVTLTRYVADLGQLRDVNQKVLLEIELATDYIDALLELHGQGDRHEGAKFTAFQGWLDSPLSNSGDETSPTRRKLLGAANLHATLRREMGSSLKDL